MYTRARTGTTCVSLYSVQHDCFCGEMLDECPSWWVYWSTAFARIILFLFWNYILLHYLLIRALSTALRPIAKQASYHACIELLFYDMLPSTICVLILRKRRSATKRQQCLRGRGGGKKEEEEEEECLEGSAFTTGNSRPATVKQVESVVATERRENEAQRKKTTRR